MLYLILAAVLRTFTDFTETPDIYKNKISLNPQNTRSFMRVFTVFIISSNVLTYSVHEALINVYFSVLSFISLNRIIYFFNYTIHSSIHSAIIYSIVHPFIPHEVDHKLFQFFVYLYTISTNYFICYFFVISFLQKFGWLRDITIHLTGFLLFGSALKLHFT